MACFSRPVVTFPNASLLTAELLVKASEISTKFFADSSVSFDKDSNLSAIFAKSPFCLSTESLIALRLLSTASINDLFPSLRADSICSKRLLDFFPSRKTNKVKRPVITGFAIATPASKPFISKISV